MKLIHFSDMHAWRPLGMDGDPTFKRFLGLLNLWLRRLRKYPPTWREKVAETIAAREADCVVFTGDISTASLIGEFDAGRQCVAPIAAKWGDRFIAIPGNHDRYSRWALRQRLFERRFLGQELAPGTGEAQPPPTYPFARLLGEGVGLVAIDTSAPRMFSSRGALSARAIDDIARLVEAQRAQTPFVIVAGHYPVAFPHGVSSGLHHRLPRREQLARALAQAGAAMYLHGHKHYRWALRPAVAPELLCVNAGTSGVKSAHRLKAAGFLELELDSGGVRAIQATIVRGPAGRLGTVSFPMKIERA